MICKAHSIYSVYSYKVRITSPLLSPSILAEWLPNCIALFFLLLAMINPNFLVASRRSILSPVPSGRRGSIFTCAGRFTRKSTTERERKGCLASFPTEDIIRSSRPRLRVGIRSMSSCSYMHQIRSVIEYSNYHQPHQ